MIYELWLYAMGWILELVRDQELAHQVLANIETFVYLLGKALGV